MRRLLLLPALLVLGCASDAPETLDDVTEARIAEATEGVTLGGDPCDLLSPALAADVLEVSVADLEGPERTSDSITPPAYDMCWYNTDMVRLSVTQVRDFGTVAAADAAFEGDFYPASAEEAARVREALSEGLDEMRASGDYDDADLDGAEAISEAFVTGEDDAARAPWPTPVAGLGDRAVQYGYQSFPSGVAIRVGSKIVAVDATMPSPTDIEGNLARSRKAAEAIVAQL